MTEKTNEKIEVDKKTIVSILKSIKKIKHQSTLEFTHQNEQMDRMSKLLEMYLNDDIYPNAKAYLLENLQKNLKK